MAQEAVVEPPDDGDAGREGTRKKRPSKDARPPDGIAHANEKKAEKTVISTKVRIDAFSDSSGKNILRTESAHR